MIGKEIRKLNAFRRGLETGDFNYGESFAVLEISIKPSFMPEKTCSMCLLVIHFINHWGNVPSGNVDATLFSFSKDNKHLQAKEMKGY